MFEVCFLHKVKDIFSVEGNSMIDENLVVELFVQRQYLLNLDPFCPRLNEVDVFIDYVNQNVTLFYFQN